MRKFFACLLLGTSAFSAKAALFISNNTPCTVLVFVYAHDAANPSLSSQTITLLPSSSIAFNNVSSLNTSPGWAGGVMASTAGGTQSWSWDCYKFDFMAGNASGGVGVTCGSPSPQVYANGCNGQPVTATWTTIGANTFITF